MYHVYALHSKKFNKIYIGYTSNLEKRLRSHNRFDSRGYTAKYRPWVLVYKEEYLSKSNALRREKQLKSARGRLFVWEQINSS